MTHRSLPVAVICGISGQDGAYLAQFLLNRGYRVFGTSRDAHASRFENLKCIGVFNRVEIVSMVLTDFQSVLRVLSTIMPDEIYNLSGQSSVGLSFAQPVETIESISSGMLNLLEVMRFLGDQTKLYNACSSECFGDTGTTAANESTPFRPQSPYAVAKSSAFWQAKCYRDAFHTHVCSGILFNHESPLRPERFVTQKIVRSACRIAAGSKEKLKLGNLNIERDWGWAPDYVEAMWLMLQREIPDDYIIATGQSYLLKDFVEHVFRRLQLDWQEHTQIDQSHFRPTDQLHSRADPSKARQLLGWKPECNMPMVVDRMVSAAHSACHLAGSV
jgi:GDPmannose 4,6-dehydratase